MHNHHIKEMVRQLIEDGLVFAGKEQLAAEASLEEYWKDKMALTWGVEDVIVWAEAINIKLTDEQAAEVLAKVFHK